MTTDKDKISTDNANTTTSFYSKADWSAFWVAFVVVFSVYCYTIAPTVTLEDSGELCTASAHAGVPHPPGYPLWTIITWYFTKIFSFVTYMGKPNPAWAVALASAFFGALAAGFASILICKSGADILRSTKFASNYVSTSTERLFCWLGGVLSSMVFAFSQVAWSQSVIAEVYALNAFFLSIILFLAYTWARAPHEPLKTLSAIIWGFCICLLTTITSFAFINVQRMDFEFYPTGVLYIFYSILAIGLTAFLMCAWIKNKNDRLLFLFSLIFGLSLTNYYVLLLLLASLALIVLFKDSDLCRDFIILGLPIGLGYALIKTGILPAVTHPTDMGFVVYTILGISWLVSCFYMLANGKTVVYSLLFLITSMGVYLHMPMASDMNPPMNWGYPRTYEGFLHAVFRGQYEQIDPVPFYSWDTVIQAVYYINELRGTFTLPMIIIGLLPFTAWSFTYNNKRYRALYAGIIVAAIAGGLVIIEEVMVPIGTEILALSMTYKFLIVILALMAAWGVISFVTDVVVDFYYSFQSKVDSLSTRIMALLVILGIGVIYLFHSYKCIEKIVEISAPLRVAGATLAPEIYSGIFRQIVGLILLIILPIILCAVKHILLKRSTNLSMDFDKDSQRWFVVLLVAFAVLSIFLVLLARLKGDVQDIFIQRVKFISSHALFGMAVGYGLIFGLAYTTIAFKGSNLIKWLGVIATLTFITPMPFYINGYNKELVRRYGGAEMNGHDFGWQFGNYQLRGADSITEELSPEEEPLPNPIYPKEMDPDAIFFGGTDPGRFVPTYMIYSADVRPDVYLITQNALADGTYMQVMRDLYGDNIWIPSQQDSARAFEIYVKEVEMGLRPKTGDMKMENGRVQISGALSVMEINGILTEMIFNYNNYRHSFYVEESYVIQWMYPYLEPHGLIMKINKNKLPDLSDTTIRNDSDFWDWYTRRLMDNNKFVRDIVARKSFSKLRSALAGVYANRIKYNYAENAFREAFLLYPLSPEANFRLVQETYFPQRKFVDAYRLMNNFYNMDTGNKRVLDFLNQVDSFIKVSRQIDEREAQLAQLKPGEMDHISAIASLCELYPQIGQFGKLKANADYLLSLTNLPAPLYFRLGVNLMRSNMKDMMDKSISMFMERIPADTPPEVFVDIARMYAETKMPEKMLNALTEYLKRRPADWLAWLDKCSLHLHLKQTPDAVKALDNAIRYGGREAYQRAADDPRFRDILNNLGRSVQPDMMQQGMIPDIQKRSPKKTP